jgi:uncharacterized protein (DUF952 family)
MYLYKIVSPETWKISQSEEKLSLPSSDDAFIHLAKEEQVAKIATKFFPNQDYFLLTLDSTKLKGRLVEEVNPGGSNSYYHLYEGSIPTASVIKSEMFKQD